MHDPYFITHKAYLKDIESTARSTRLCDHKVGDSSHRRDGKMRLMLSVFLACAVALPFVV